MTCKNPVRNTATLLMQTWKKEAANIDTIHVLARFTSAVFNPRVRHSIQRLCTIYYQKQHD